MIDGDIEASARRAEQPVEAYFMSVIHGKIEGQTPISMIF
jgi:hypothetical protein